MVVAVVGGVMLVGVSFLTGRDDVEGGGGNATAHRRLGVEIPETGGERRQGGAECRRVGAGVEK